MIRTTPPHLRMYRTRADWPSRSAERRAARDSAPNQGAARGLPMQPREKRPDPASVIMKGFICQGSAVGLAPCPEVPLVGSWPSHCQVGEPLVRPRKTLRAERMSEYQRAVFGERLRPSWYCVYSSMTLRSEMSSLFTMGQLTFRRRPAARQASDPKRAGHLTCRNQVPLCRRLPIWSGRWGSNPRPSAWEAESPARNSSVLPQNNSRVRLAGRLTCADTDGVLPPHNHLSPRLAPENSTAVAPRAE
jgi:hypothetical protein